MERASPANRDGSATRDKIFNRLHGESSPAGPFLEIFLGGSRAYILPTKMDVVPIIEDYLFTWEDFMDKCNNLTSFLLRRKT